MKCLRDESGQVLVMTVFCMAVLLGCLGLAIDVGVLLRAQRNMQTAADAAAMAGATELFYNGVTNVDARAYAAAKANGVDNTVSGNVVNVTLSPTLAGGSACSSCVEVQLSTPNPTIFMKTMSQLVFGQNNYNSVNVSALAVAGAPSTTQTCMYVMDPTDADTLWIHGAGDINAPGCAVYVNSNNSGALCVTGNAGKSTAAVINVVGGQDSKGNCKGDPGLPVNTSAGVQSLPALWSAIPSDPTSKCSSVTDLAGSGGTLAGKISGPGYGNYACYTDSATGKKGAITPVNLNSAQLGPGNYVFETGVTVSGNTIVGNGSGTTTATNGGATIIVTGSGAFDSSTATNFTVYAPADSNAVYNAIAIYQPVSDTSAMMLQFGSSSSYFMGTVLAPGAPITLHDQGGAVNAATLVVGQIYVNGTVNLSSYSSYNQSTSPFRQVTLVE